MIAEFRLSELRNSRTRTRAALIAAVLALALRPMCAGAVAVSSTEGKVLYLRSGSYTWAQISSGQLLSPGDQLKTATGARASVTFDDASRVDLNPGSSFTLKEATPQASGMELKLGSLKAWISKSLNRRFQVRTPTAVCSVRGTEFGVDVDGTGDTHVQMFGGLLAVADKSGNEVLIKDKESLDVTRDGLGKVTDAGPREETGGGDARQAAKREVDLRMSKEEVQAAAAEESKLSEFREGKALIDVNGNRVRIEEYIVRPAADQFKLVVLNERPDRFDYFFYQGTFNQALPTDMSSALRQIPGCINVACDYFLTSYRTGRSNTTDAMLEVAGGGHLVDVNNNGVAGDRVEAAYDPATASFVSLSVPTPGGAGNQPYFQTLFNTYNITFNGVSHQSWTQSAAGLAQPGGNITNTTTDVAYTNVTTVQNMPGCAPPDCTYNEIGEGIFHDVVYAADGTGLIWEKYDSYIISDAGKIAKTADFAATSFSGQSFKTTLLGWNFQTIVTASEFAGRKIDLVVEPKIFIQSGLIP
ncbi:MAG: FecR domain-containing protein [Elusimicrobia bacterium]|nr:FecR domain-containing protein [Elusimicrobiota bacterium]